MTGEPPIPEVVAQRYDPAVPLDQLHLHPANPNDGDLGLISDSLDAHGFYGAVLAQESTGIVFAGNHRLKTARARSMPSLPVLWLDVDDDTRDRILAMDNEATRRGRNDESLLVDLLSGLSTTERGLTGTGYTGEELDDLVALLNRKTAYGEAPTDPRSEWDGMPDFNQPDREAVFVAHIGFRSQEDATEFFKLIDRPQVSKLWWPDSDGLRGSDKAEMEVWDDTWQRRRRDSEAEEPAR